MSYIGNTATTQAFTPAVDYFSGNGSTTAFTLSRPVASVAQVEAVIDNVVQNPSSAYTVSANTITFSSAPLSGTNNIYVRYTSPITQVIAPGQGTVNTTALGNITNIASGNSSLTLQTGSSPTTAVTIDTSQNVGIGTTPRAKLEISKSSDSASPSRTPADYSILFTAAQSNTYNNGIGVTEGTYVNSAITPFDSGSGGAQGWSFITGNNTAIAEAMRINSSGYVGIGDTNPQSSLAVNSTTNPQIRVAYTGVHTYGVRVTSGGNFAIQDTDASSADRLTIDSSGNVGIGVTSINSAVRLSVLGTPAGWTDNGIFEVRGSSNASNGARLSFGVSAATSGYAWIRAATPGISNDNISLNPDGGRILINTTSGSYTLTCNGQPGANGYTAWANYSDARLKENIENFYPAGSLSKVLQLRPVTFNYNELSGHDEATRARRISGFIAQELQPIYPEMVGTTKIGDTEYFDTNTSDLTLHLVKAIQELKAINDTQAETINALTARIVALEGR